MTEVEIASGIARERQAARARYGPLASAHEGYGVLAEEMDELLSAIRQNDRDAVQAEASQLAAVAWNLAVSLTDDNQATLKRSGMGPRPPNR